MTKTTRIALFVTLVLGSAAAFWAMVSTRDRPFPYGLALFTLCLMMAVLAYAVAMSTAGTIVKRTLRVGLATIAGVLGLLPLGAVFDHLNWPIFHSWGLGHGSFLVAAPAIGFLAHFLLGMIPLLRESPGAG